ncbi:hypothetical protein BHE74_00044914 [Ensete ventricosum]|nr:hypothetical protein GW17_00047848 [Ensete ventricosum]RWW48974.1 hypothetical protein BHE74_00044914 [Ensete ventricosum]
MIVVGFGSSPLLSFCIQISGTPSSRVDGRALVSCSLIWKAKFSIPGMLEPALPVSKMKKHTVTNFEAATLPFSNCYSCLGCRGRSNSTCGLKSNPMALQSSEQRREPMPEMDEC